MATKLRTGLEPDLKTAEAHYPVVLEALLKYTSWCDEHGDEELHAYRQLEDALHQLTGKDLSLYNLGEWWEEEGAEVLAFRISLPDPLPARDITKAELTEIVTRLKDPAAYRQEQTNFSSLFSLYLDEYYHVLLKLNFNSYRRQLFQRNKDRDGRWFEYTTEEIIKQLWADHLPPSDTDQPVN
ncbi:hypothetical protein [Niabella beijingensis]|uniref:hypothetical protein n=1 Tax=Niabella beijingensis TaxID=2872700 RepID=UPI001CBDC91F|nr:hypothetical protein [Niabella beijingensis]MBZ4192595.1 hypothetical protein [Niabella beijingensis]